MSEEVKVVIALKDGRTSIGVRAPDCDPIFDIQEGGLEAALERIPGLVEEARQRWAESPLYPKCESPLPSQATPPRVTVPQRTASPQQSMF